MLYAAKRIIVLCLIGSVIHAGFCFADDPASDDQPSQPRRPSIWQRESLTGNFFDLGRELENSGITVSLGATQVYQYNIHDGLQAGRGGYAGSYDLEVEADLDALLGLSGGSLFMLTEGSWRGGDGFDARTVGSLFGVNDDEGEHWRTISGINPGQR